MLIYDLFFFGISCEVVFTRFHLQQPELWKQHIIVSGNDKVNLDSVGDLNILLHDIVKYFGRFLKIYVEKDLQCTTPTVVNGLSVIMATQQ